MHPHEFPAPPHILMAHLFAAPAGWQMSLRRLQDYQLQYCKDGEVEYIIEGVSYPMPPGTLLLIRPQEAHEIRCAPDVSHVCYSFVFRLGDAAGKFEAMVGPARSRSGWKGSPLEGRMSQLAALYHQPGPEHRMKCQSILLDIFSILYRRRLEESGGGGGTASDLARARMNRVQAYIANRYREEVTHDELEREAGISRNHIIRQFRRIYGMTPMQYVTYLRVEEAKSLAVRTSMSVSEIAERVGYSDVHTFGRAFRRVVGVSLSQYCAGLVADAETHRPPFS